MLCVFALSRDRKQRTAQVALRLVVVADVLTELKLAVSDRSSVLRIDFPFLHWLLGNKNTAAIAMVSTRR